MRRCFVEIMRISYNPRNNILRLRAMKKIRNTGMRNILPVLRSAL